jgi:hypothetical protein
MQGSQEVNSVALASNASCIAVTSACGAGSPVGRARFAPSETTLRQSHLANHFSARRRKDASKACDIFARKVNGEQHSRLVGNGSARQRPAHQPHRQHNLRAARRYHALLVADLEEPLMPILSAFAACEKI